MKVYILSVIKIQIIDKLSEYFLSFEKALKDYFDNTK